LELTCLRAGIVERVPIAVRRGLSRIVRGVLPPLAAVSLSLTPAAAQSLASAATQPAAGGGLWLSWLGGIGSLAIPVVHSSERTTVYAGSGFSY
jgi:hypothetical protein